MRLVEAVADEDAKAALELVAELAADGVDLRRFVSESVSFFRGAFLAHYAPNLAEIADEPADVYEAWRKAAQLVSASDVLRAVDLLGDALVRLREGREERLMTELALIKLTRPETASDTEALLARVERIERRLGKPDPVPTTPQVTTAPAPASVATPVPEDTATSAASSVPEPTPTAAASETDSSPEVQPKAEAPAIDISLEQLQKVWPGLFGSLRDVLGARRWAFFRESVPAGVEGNVILLEVPHGFHLQSLQEDDAVSAIVATRASDLLGGKVEVKFGLRETAPDGGGDQTIDMSQLEERPAAATDPTSLLAAELGAEVVEE
jgi:DNA polymerase-3 subunit gamma/tau